MRRMRVWGLAAVPAVAIVLLTAVWGFSQMPVPPDFQLTQTKDLTPVTFSHKFHVQEKKLECTACHVQVFQMKKGDTMKGKAIPLADMMAGKYCGACHNGQKSFAMSECAKCHPAKK